MSGSRAGLIMMISGTIIVAVGAVGWVTSLEVGSPAPSSTKAPAATTTGPTTTLTTPISTTSTTPPTSRAPSTTTTTIEAGPAIESFVETFTDAIARADTELLLEALHPAVITLFDEESCRAFITDEILELDRYRLIGEVEGPLRQVVADMTLDMYTAPVAFAVQDQEFTSEAAFAFLDGEVRWFTQCGG